MRLNIASPSELVKSIGFALALATVARTPIAVNGKLMIPVNTAEANAHNAFVYEAEVNDATATTEAWAVNDPIYYTAANGGALTKTAAGGTFFGYALQPKASGVLVSPLVAFNTYFTPPA